MNRKAFLTMVAAAAGAAISAFAADVSTPELKAALTKRLWSHEATADVRLWPADRLPAGAEENRVYFTQKGDAVYAIVFGATAGGLRLGNLAGAKSATRLGSSEPVAMCTDGDALVVTLAEPVPAESALVFRFQLR